MFEKATSPVGVVAIGIAPSGVGQDHPAQEVADRDPPGIAMGSSDGYGAGRFGRAGHPLILVGAVGVFVVLMNAQPQHRSYVLMSAGH
jgi:fermentation-respiration switch protein FrsA (DUF1100 family)